MKKKYLWILGIGLIALALTAGPIMSNVEQAKYTVVEHSDVIEIRDYEPMIVAEVEVPGAREEAIRQGFRMIADYIFGNNISSQKVAMTAPVIQQSSQKIAMTPPVTQQSGSDGDNVWKVRFVMPSEYTLEKLPKPKDASIRLREVEPKRYAVIRFSGSPSLEHLSDEQSKLDAFISQRTLKPLSSPIYAFFNPPWTLPLLRRNEIMIEIDK